MGQRFVRLKRALATDRCTAAQIRGLVAELPDAVGLEDALAILLALAAVRRRWAARTRPSSNGAAARSQEGHGETAGEN